MTLHVRDKEKREVLGNIIQHINKHAHDYIDSFGTYKIQEVFSGSIRTWNCECDKTTFQACSICETIMTIEVEDINNICVCVMLHLDKYVDAK